MQSRRPRRNHQQWLVLIQKFNQSELTQRQFCEAEQLGLATFRKWLRKHSTANPGGKQVISSSRGQGPESASSGFGPVTISPSPHLPAGACLELPGNIFLHTQDIPPVEYLRTLVEVLGHGH